MPGAFGGGDMGDAAQQAAAVQAQAAQRAADLQWQMYQQGRADLAPWRTAGTTAVGTWGDILSGKQDPTAILKNYPGYQWLLNQGTQARDMGAASKGLALSGAQQKGLTDWGQGLAQTYAWQPYMASLQDLSGQGMGAAGQTGNWGMGAGQQMGQDYMQAGRAQAQGIWNAALANQNNNAGWGSLLGMGLGALAAPFTGGTSLLGSAMSGIGNWFGGGGGAPSYEIGGGLNTAWGI